MPIILAIDDDLSSLSAVATALEGAGYEVHRISSIKEARHYLDEKEPDLIVLEVAADAGAGWDLLRDIVRFQGPATIVVTSRGREDEIVEALSIGAADVLAKPFRSNELVARVRSRLGAPTIYLGPPSGAPAIQLGPSPAAPAPSRLPPAPVRRPLARPREETVFMDHASEQALLEAPAPSGEIDPDEASLPLGPRLRAVRQRRKLTLVQVNLETKIPIWYLQAMEEEKFSLLPRGPAAIDMVRTYATYLGLNPAQALAEYRAHHDASPFRPLPSLGGTPEPREFSPWLGILVAAALALALGFGGIWYFAGERVSTLGNNVRGLVFRPTATATPSPTMTPTVIPTPTLSPTPTETPSPTVTPTVQPSPTPAPPPTPIPQPAVTITAGA